MTTEDKYNYLVEYTKQNSMYIMLCSCQTSNIINLRQFVSLERLWDKYVDSDDFILEDNNGILLINLLYKIVNNYSKNNSK